MPRHTDPERQSDEPWRTGEGSSDVPRNRVIDWIAQKRNELTDDLSAARASVGDVTEEPLDMDPATLELGRLLGRSQVLNEAAAELERGDEQGITQPTLFEDV